MAERAAMRIENEIEEQGAGKRNGGRLSLGA